LLITEEMLEPDSIKKDFYGGVPKYLELPPMKKQGKLRYVLESHWRNQRRWKKPTNSFKN